MEHSGISLSLNGGTQTTLNFSFPGRSRASSSSAAADDASDAFEPEQEESVELAAHERKRSMKRKSMPEAGPRGRSKALKRTIETRVSLAKRLAEFPDSGLTVSAKHLFCLACREALPNLKESIRRHVNSSKHVNKMEMRSKHTQNSCKMHDDLAEYFKENEDCKGVSGQTV